MHHGVEAHHVRGAEGRALLGRPMRGPEEQVHPPKASLRAGSVVCSTAGIENTPTRLATKLGVSLARTMLLPRRVVQPGFKAIEASRDRCGGRDQLDQRHVARRG